MQQCIQRFYFKLVDPKGKLRTEYVKLAAYSFRQAACIVASRFPTMTLFEILEVNIGQIEFKTIQ